jgi:ABC-2 type transport system permease protein
MTSILHIYGVFLKNIYLMRRSFPRLFQMFFWISIELFFWGFVTLWLKDIASNDARIDFVLFLLTAVIFWDIFVRSAHSISFSFLEEIWARNIFNIFGSPIKTKEFVLGMATLGVLNGFVALVFASILALLLYSLNMLQVGIYIVPFFINILIFGWALGLISTGLLIRFGPSVEGMTFAIPFVFLPLSAVYYPVSAFPEIIQNIAQFVPGMHLFEGMRFIFNTHQFPIYHTLWATSLNVVYILVASLFLAWMLHIARKRGLIARLMTD